MSDIQQTPVYIRRDTQRPQYIPFTNFLMDLPLSLTAKLLYAQMLSRALLSQKNGWMDKEGRVYILFPESEMCKAVHKGLTTVKTALRDLEKAGLLEKAPHPHSSVNRIYLKIIPDTKTRKKKRAVNPGIRDYSYEGEDSL